MQEVNAEACLVYHLIKKCIKWRPLKYQIFKPKIAFWHANLLVGVRLIWSSLLPASYWWFYRLMTKMWMIEILKLIKHILSMWSELHCDIQYFETALSCLHKFLTILFFFLLN
jgi:hypothetical protein